MHPTVIVEVNKLAGPSQQERMADLQGRVIALEHQVKPQKEDHGLRNGIAAVVVSAVLLGVGWWVWFITTNVVAMKQQLMDGGNKQIVAELRSPKSPQQLQANLSTVIAQVQTARLDNKTPNPEKMESLTGAISEVVKRNPDLPEAWQAAVQLVNYKYQAPTTSTEAFPNCQDTLRSNNPEIDRLVTSNGEKDYPDFSGPQMPQWMAHIYLGHCNLNIDDDGNFGSTPIGKFFEDVRRHHPQVTRFFLIVNNAHITYSGKKMIPISGIQFTDCTFELTQPVNVPDKINQAITTQLLASATSSGKIEIPNS